MEIYDGLRIQYTHAAIPPYGIKLNRTYEIKVDSEKIFIITDHKEELILSEYLLKVLFSLVDGEWSDLEKQTK